MFFRSTNRYGIRSCDWCEKTWFCGDKTWLWPQNRPHTHMETLWVTGHDLFNFCQVRHPKMSFCLVCGVVPWCCCVCQSKNWVMCTIWILWVLKLWNAKITNWKKLRETFSNSHCFLDPRNCTHILLQNMFLAWNLNHRVLLKERFETWTMIYYWTYWKIGNLASYKMQLHLLVSIFLVSFQFVILNLHCLPFLPHGWAAGRHELCHAGFVPCFLQAGCLRYCRKECLYLNDIFCF